MTIEAKICGLTSSDALDAVLTGGASMVGFVFFPASPRAVTPMAAAALMARVPDGVTKVALLVDPDDFDVDAVCRQLPVDLIQLHGSESLQRVASIKAMTGLPVMKAVGIKGPDDLKRAHAFESVCDRILLDAKAPKDADLPGGNALTFDWTLIAGEIWTKPWMLAGGLTADNVAEAVKISGAAAVDVSSGVEDVPGRKSVDKIRTFLKVTGSL